MSPTAALLDRAHRGMSARVAEACNKPNRLRRLGGRSSSKVQAVSWKALLL